LSAVIKMTYAVPVRHHGRQDEVALAMVDHQQTPDETNTGIQKITRVRARSSQKYFNSTASRNTNIIVHN